MTTATATPNPVRELRSERARIWTTFKRNKLAIVGLGMVLTIVIIALAAPIITNHDPIAQAARERLSPPSNEHFLGQDDYGRDIFTRIIYGARVSLMVGVLSVLLGGTIGTVMGVVAGFKGGRIEIVIMRIVDTLLAFPDLITGLLVLAVLGSGLDKLIFAIGIVISPRFARLAHGPTLALRERDFVNAAHSIGVGDIRMLSKHILPNVMSELLVMASLWTASAIRIEANLSFIGLGVSPPTPTWGQMIRDGTAHLTTSPWFSIFPGIAILVTVLAFNLLGDGLRDVLDPKLQR
ncbi:MAG: ABC transporter permease [Chloroflexota bacterium]